MAEEGNQGVIPEPESGAEIEPNQQPENDDGVMPEKLQAELEETRKALKAANRESAQRRKRLEELEKQEAERQEAELSEMEKLQKKLAEQQAEIERVQNEARQVRVKSAVITKASEMNFQDPEDAYRLIDVSAIEVDSNGQPEGVDELLQALAESKPYMIKKAQKFVQGAATNPGDNVTGTGETEAQQRARLYGTSAPNLFTPEQARKLGGGVIITEK